MADEFGEIMPPALNEIGESSEGSDTWALPPPTEAEQSSNNDFYGDQNQQDQQPDFGSANAVPQEQEQPVDFSSGSFFPQDSEPAGMEAPESYDSFAPTDSTSSSFPEPEEVMKFEDKAAQFTFEWENRLKQQEAEEIAAKQTLKEAAEKYLDNFHDKKTDEKLAKMENNRKSQDEIAAENERLLEIARSDDLSRWKRVYELVNTDVSENENGRMARLLVNLKIKGKCN